ncbi:MAG: signal recognition particle protein [Planctomycetales bacterium]|nr:signal recognition particle protein [bacterium]UNM09654.1 MAG: signal recognition particle protein [Planctomycetales bacterium]
MFNKMQDRILGALKNMAKSGRLSEADVEKGLREIRLALLEADVNLSVTKKFISRVQQKAVGQDVLGQLNPIDTLVMVVYEELTELLGGKEYDPKFDPGVKRIMMVGLQGSGKTTTSGKLANRFKSEGKKPLLIAADLSRPAAVDQLQVLGKQIHVDVFADPKSNPVDLAKNGLKQGDKDSNNPVIIDTAGRLAIDEELMDELVKVKEAFKPDEILLVVDALTGQDAVETAQRFDEKLNITGIVLTKMDGDARGGAAMSMRAVTGKPIRLTGTGEKLDALEYFFPDRMASRILGRGDIATLIEKASKEFDDEDAEKLEKKLRRQKTFDLEDFIVALRQTRRMGSMKSLLNMIPGVRVTDDQAEAGEKQLRKFEAIVNSMTRQERLNPKLLNASRRRRIAIGSGTSVQDINSFINNFKQMQRMTSTMLKSGAFKRMQ